MANILELTNLTADLGAEALERAMQRSAFFRNAEFRLGETDGIYTPVTVAGQPDFRPLNTAYTAVDNENPSPSIKQLKFLGKDCAIDTSYVMDYINGSPRLAQHRRGKVIEKAQSFADGFDLKTFSGTGTGSQILGFGATLTGGIIAPFGINMIEDAVPAASGALDVTNPANYDAFIAALRRTIALVPGANMICMNRQAWGVFQAACTAKNLINRELDNFGVLIETFDGIQVCRLADGAILNTELNGLSVAGSTSIYVLRNEEYGGVVFETNTGFMYTDFPNLDNVTRDWVDNNTYKSKMQLYYQIHIDHADAVRRLRWIKVV